MLAELLLLAAAVAAVLLAAVALLALQWRQLRNPFPSSPWWPGRCLASS